MQLLKQLLELASEPKETPDPYQELPELGVKLRGKKGKKRWTGVTSGEKRIIDTIGLNSANDSA